MATHHVPRQVAGFNSAQFPSISPLALAPAMVAALVDLTDAERDLDGYVGQDPALAAYTDAVDAARARVLTHCAVILAAETADEMAHGLQMATKMVRTVLTTETPTEVAMIRNILAMRHNTVLFPLYRAGLPRYNALLDTAFDALAAYIALPAPGGEVVDHEEMSCSATVAHTGMSRCFTALLGAMARFVRADQMLQRPVAGDVRAPQFTSAMASAEDALTAMHDALHQVMAADLLRREDRALWEMGYGLFSLIGQDDDDARLFLFHTLVDYQPQFMVPGTHAVARQTRQMQARFFELAAEMMQLQDFGGPDPDGDGACGPALAA
jgi:hypothetical protein